MISGFSDSVWQDFEENTKKSLKESEQFKNHLFLKLKKATHSEKEFILFKTFFNGIKSDEISLIDILKQHPSLINRLLWIKDEADSAKRLSSNAKYNRNKSCLEVMKVYKMLLEKISVLSKELNTSNSLELSILFSYLLWNGYLSKNKTHKYEEYDGPLLMGMNFTDISNGIGVCRNYSEMLKDFLNHNGYESVMLTNYLSNNLKVDYKMNITERKIYNAPYEEIFQRKKANHVFNLIEDNGLYIYDPTNLLLYNLKNKNMSTLVNGKGKNIVYPYRSYDFCYSKEDEELLDRLFNEDAFTSLYDKTDFISISEETLELIKNNTSLLEDFYTEARQDIIGISEETKKVLTRIR